MLDLSVIAKVYLPALSLATFAFPFFSVIVKPGPTTPASLGGAIADADHVTVSAARARTSVSAREIRFKTAPCSRFCAPGPPRRDPFRVGMETVGAG